VVPGVSGGTVALGLGIYERLLNAISHIDLHLLRLVRGGRWREAAGHMDLRFLVTLLGGIGVGFLAMTLAMHRLLTSEYSRSLTLAAFFGMIAASGILVAMRVRVRSPGHGVRILLIGTAGAAGALWLALQPGQAVEPSYGYIFVCGAVGICAMILPGISGAMILLLLGVYTHLTGIPEELLHGENVGRHLLTIVIFGAGCGLTLIGFSKILRWLLTRLPSETLALLCGLMVGALPKLWPFQKDMTPEVEKWKLKEFHLDWPHTIDQTIAVILVALLGFAAVMIVHWVSHTRAARSFRAAPLTGEAKS
jgi:putative membrane protein